MQKILMTLALGAAFSCAILAPSLAADAANEIRPVDAKVTKIALDGIVALKVRQGATPSLVVYGDKAYIGKITTTQNGDTLRIGTDIHEMREFRAVGPHRTEMRAELTLPALNELVSSGIGSSDVSGFGGDALRVSLSGAGKMQVISLHKLVRASLSGVGQLTIDAGDAETVELALPGAGSVVATGKTKKLSASLSGVGNLDAREMSAARATVTLSGLGNASVNVSQEINVIMSGLGSATVYGQPVQRHSTNSGMGRVEFK